jgi:protein phosphatase
MHLTGRRKIKLHRPKQRGMKLSLAGYSLQGSRKRQEDCYEICSAPVQHPHCALIVLCDGMGGHGGGDIASSLVAHEFVNSFVTFDVSSPPEALNAALQAAHQALRRKVRENRVPSDMGTTLVAVYIEGDSVHWVSVGDSHLYRYHGQHIEKLNADHLRSCISASEIALIETKSLENALQQGDKLILASDGLDTLSRSQLQQVIRRHRRQSAERLTSTLLDAVEKANRPGQDNTTVVVINTSRKSLWCG